MPSIANLPGSIPIGTVRSRVVLLSSVQVVAILLTGGMRHQSVHALCLFGPTSSVNLSSQVTAYTRRLGMMFLVTRIVSIPNGGGSSLLQSGGVQSYGMTGDFKVFFFRVQGMIICSTSFDMPGEGRYDDAASKRRFRSASDQY